MTSAAAVKTRSVTVPIGRGELVLHLPVEVSEQTLNKEIASQDVIRQKLLGTIDKLERTIGTNRELLLCSHDKLRTITREFLGVCGELRRLIDDLSTYHSAIPELEEARGDVKIFFYGHISGEINKIEALQLRVFARPQRGRYVSRQELHAFRKKLAKSTGMVRTELQKIFAHLFTRDPRNLYRQQGPRSQQEILFRQFRRDVEVTERLYHAVRRLDTYMRGAIVPSDVLQMIATRIERERSLACLFDPDYALFLNSLLDEVLEGLLPEIREVLTLDGIWYDDFENVERKAEMLSRASVTFKAFFSERLGLRSQIRELAARTPEAPPAAVLAVFDTFRSREIAEGVRTIDQILVDLEGSLLHWEKGVARRAFARPEWREAEPLLRRAGH